MKRVVFSNEKMSDNFKKYRLNRHLSLIELSKETNISLDKINKLESGTAIPNIDELVILANFYNVPIDNLISYEIY